MFKKMMTADVGFKSRGDEGLEVRVGGYKPLVKAGMYQLIAQLAEVYEKTVEEFCHEMIELDKAVNLELAKRKAPVEEVFNVAFGIIMEGEAKSVTNTLDGLLDKLFGEGASTEFETFMSDHEHDCDNCGAYDICDLPYKTKREQE